LPHPTRPDGDNAPPPPQTFPEPDRRLPPDATQLLLPPGGPNLWGWATFPPGMKAPALMELAKRQAWTLKPAVLYGPMR
jgi:hypothetical protein